MFFNSFQTSSHSVEIKRKRNGLAVLHQCFMPLFVLFFNHGYILSVKEKLPDTDIRYFGNYLTYLDVLIYFHHSGQRPNSLLAKISSASLGTAVFLRT